ncbi:MAG: hypothetical protein M3014_13570, partial [Chloroflexota bacterium]|nr:hypothetical protein [Chloroflexota bacterium]
YAGGWNDALAGKPDPLFQYHHQPFAFFATYADGTTAKSTHLKDEQDFISSLTSGNLPAVSYIKPLGPDNEHPGYASLLRGQQHVADLVQAVQSSPYWADTAIIITYDENGGRWDHVAPPAVDRWGMGTRVPAIIISPFAKKGYVDHTRYDTTSILKLIENRWGLAPLSSRDAAANDLSNAFDFQQGATPTPTLAPATATVVAPSATSQPAPPTNVPAPITQEPATPSPTAALEAATAAPTALPTSVPTGMPRTGTDGLTADLLLSLIAGMITITAGIVVRRWRTL